MGRETSNMSRQLTIRSEVRLQDVSSILKGRVFYDLEA